jgi:hypothetical protein
MYQLLQFRTMRRIGQSSPSSHSALKKGSRLHSATVPMPIVVPRFSAAISRKD